MIAQRDNARIKVGWGGEFVSYRSIDGYSFDSITKVLVRIRMCTFGVRRVWCEIQI